MFENIFNSEKCIHIKPNDRSQNEAEELSKKIGISIHEAENEFLWHEITGREYRFKFSNHLVRILNELIGPKIANRFNLRTVNNIPAIMDVSDTTKYYGILSENFKDPNKEYLTMHQLGFKNSKGIDAGWRNISKLKRYCSKEDYGYLKNNLFKMTCIDHIMGQADRVASNFLFEKDEERIVFAPLFDYAEAYESIKEGCPYDKYNNRSLPFSVGNAFMTLSFWHSKFKWLLIMYPEFIEYLDIASRIDIIEILEEIEAEHNLNISDECKYYYEVRTKEKQKVLIY